MRHFDAFREKCIILICLVRRCQDGASVDRVGRGHTPEMGPHSAEAVGDITHKHFAPLLAHYRYTDTRITIPI